MIAAALSLVAAFAPSASAGTLFLNEPFDAAWSAGTNWSRGGNVTPVIATPAGQTPASAMRITPAVASQYGSLLYNVARPTAYGLDVSFVLSEWRADDVFSSSNCTYAFLNVCGHGVSFYLKKGTDTSVAPGQDQGSLGYSTDWGYVFFGSHPYNNPGVSGALLGVGFDAGGRWTEAETGGSGCGSSTYPGSAGTGFQIDTIAIRGPGQGIEGYCQLAKTAPGAVDFGRATRLLGARSIRITVDPSTDPSPKVKVWYALGTGGTSGLPILTIDEPAQLRAEATFKFGFAASTGSYLQNNEIWNMQSGSLVAIPEFQITTPCSPLADATVRTAYSQALDTDYGVGDTSWSITSGVLPAGVTMNGATGTISGAPTKVGSYAITLRAQDSRATPSVATASCLLNVVDSAAVGVVGAKPKPSTTGIQLTFAAPAAGTTRTTGIRTGKLSHRRLVVCTAPSATTSGPENLSLRCGFTAATKQLLCRAPMTVRVFVEFTPAIGPKEVSVSTIRLARVWGCATRKPAAAKPTWLIWPYTPVSEPITG